MKRGRQYPHTRAPWSLGAFRPSAWGPPAYVIQSNVFEFIADPLEPGVVTDVVGIMPPIRWAYEQSSAGIVWHQDWVTADFLYNGSFTFHQELDNDNENCRASVDVVFNYIGFPSYHDDWSLAANADGTWQSVFFGFGQSFAFSGVRDLRLIFYNFSALLAQSYQDLETAGIDSHDTAPVTWDY